MFTGTHWKTVIGNVKRDISHANIDNLKWKLEKEVEKEKEANEVKDEVLKKLTTLTDQASQRKLIADMERLVLQAERHKQAALKIKIRLEEFKQQVLKEEHVQKNGAKHSKKVEWMCETLFHC